MSACQERPFDRRRPVARPDAAQARRGLSEAAQHRPAVRRGRDLPQPFHPGCALRAGAGQPADQPVPDEPSGGAEHHPARQRASPTWRTSCGAAATTRPWSATPRPRPIRAPRRPTIRASSCWATSWTASTPVGAFEPYADAYFGWVASQGFKLPEIREDIWLPEGRSRGAGATARPARIPKELSDTAWFTERGLTYLRGRAGKPWFLHLGYYRPHPPFIALGALPCDVPAGGHAQGRCARRVAGGGGQAERAARLLCEQHQAGELLPGRQGPGLGDERGSRWRRCAPPIAA